MKKQFSKRKLISRFLMVPLITAGIVFSVISLGNKAVENSPAAISALNSTEVRAEDDNSYFPPEDVEYRINQPNPMNFNESQLATIDFDVEKADSATWANFGANMQSFRIIFEESGTSYAESQIGYIELNYNNFDEYFAGGSTSSNVNNYKTINPVDLNSVTTFENGFSRFAENEEYQFRIWWKGYDVDQMEQYTSPTSFIYGVSAPTLSYTLYEGYSQALVEIDILLYGALLDAYGNDISNIYDKFQVTWGSNVNNDLVNLSNENEAAGTLASDAVIVDQGSTTNTIKIYLMFDNLKDGDNIQITVDYGLNTTNFGFFEGQSVYIQPFHSTKYESPKLLPISSDDVVVNDLSQISSVNEMNTYGGVTIPLTFQWVDNAFPAAWVDIDTRYEAAHFTPEITFKRIVSSIEVEAIDKVTGADAGPLDPSSIQVIDNSGTGKEGNWDNSDPDNITKETQVYFPYLELGEGYQVSLAIELNNPDMFEDSSKYVTETVSFTTPSTISEPTISLDGIKTPTNEDGTQINEPTNWNELEVDFTVNKPTDWATLGMPVTSISDVFSSFEIVAMEGTIDEVTGNVIYDESTAITKTISTSDVSKFDTQSKVVIGGLNSEHEYGIKVVGAIEPIFARVFGYEVYTGNKIESPIISSNTRTKAELPSITYNTDLHDEYDPEENSTVYTYGFYINDPLDGSWNFVLDDSAEPDYMSAFYYKNIIQNVYITNVYSETDVSSPEAQALFAKKFFVNNDTPGQTSASTDVSQLHINNATDDIPNANSITIDGLKSTWLYSANLVIELTDEAIDATNGWLDSETNTIQHQFNFTPGHPVKAPEIAITDITTEQTSYDRHTATVNGTIDISKLVLPDGYADTQRMYFENDVLPGAQISSDIWIEALGGIYSQLSPKAWLDILPTFTEDADGFDDADGVTPLAEYYNPTEMMYHFSFQFGNLEANTDYELFITNSEDFGYIEDVLDVADVFSTPKNEILQQDELELFVTNYEYGNQNEATNMYENITVNLRQIFSGNPDDYQTYYDQLSKNLTSLEIVDNTSRDVVATFDPETISNLTVDGAINPDTGEFEHTGFGDITATLVNPIGPKEDINLGNYSLVVGTDGVYAQDGYEVKLDAIAPEATFTTGGLDAPVINKLEARAFKGYVQFDWDVTHKNNIDTATLEIYEKEGLHEPVIVNSAEMLYDGTNFISGDDDDWEEMQQFTSPKSGEEYWAVLTINPVSDCEDVTPLQMESEHITAAEDLAFTFSVDDVKTTSDSITVDYSWVKNQGVVISNVRFQVIDTYADPVEGVPQPVIYENEIDTLPSSNGDAIHGEQSITIDNSTLLEGYELYSNQEYEIKVEYKKDETFAQYRSITEVMEDATQMDLLNPTTDEKDDSFVDSIMTSTESSEALGIETDENSFAFSYNWNNREVDSEINKNVTYNSIRIYEKGTITDENLVWESDNLIDSIPGKMGEFPVTKVHNGDTQIAGKDLANGRTEIEVIPNSEFVIVPYVEYDVYANNSRTFESEYRITQKNIKIPFAMSDIEFNTETSMFIDNETVVLDYHMTKATAFTLSSDNYIEIFVNDQNGQPHDFIYNGTLYEGTDGVKIYSDEIIPDWSHNTTDENDFADFTITLDGVTTPFEQSITVASLVHIENNDGSSNENETAIKLVNNTDQKQAPFIDSSNMGVYSRKDVLGMYWDYEIRVDSNFSINYYKDVVISEIDTPNTKENQIEVLDEAQVESEFEYNVDNLYLRVDKELVEEDAAYNDLTFLVGRYIGVDASNLITGVSSSTRVDTSWEGYDWFAIDDFFWLYPPKTFWEIILEIIIWLLIILAILLVLGMISGTGYYIFRITFSNKKWYPIVETIANEKFAVFTDYVDNFGWTQKYQEYADLKDKNIKELRQYALEMNIPVTFDLTRKELLKTVSLLTDDEIAKFETFTDDDIDVRNYEILDHWKVARYKKYNFWIKYKLSKLEEKGILNADDDRLETIQSQIEYIEKEKAAAEEREKMYEEIKGLVSDVLDTNVELTSEFSVDPLESFRKEIEEKAAAEKAEQEAIEAEIKAAVDAEEQARREAEEAEAKIIAEKNAKEVKALKAKLSFDYKKINVSIAKFNKECNKEVEGAEAAREVAEKLTLERNKINKLIDIFKQRQERIDQLGGDQEVYAFETLNKVDIKITLTKFEKFEKELESLTKQGLIDKAKKLKLEVKVSWSKDTLIKDIIRQVTERGDFDD